MEKYLNKCLDSLLVPNMDLLEVLVINDGSKDRSSEIAHEYEKKYPSVFRVIDKENGNYGSCVNRGLKEATGKYVKILDADDYYNNLEFSSFIDALRGIDVDIIFSSWSTVSLDNKLISSETVPQDLDSKNFSIDKFSFEENRVQYLRRMHCMAVKAEMMKSNSYYQTEGISYTDTQFVFYSLIYAKDILFIDKNVYQYRVGREGQTISKDSIIKNHMHYYINARRMIEDYSKYVSVNTPLNTINNIKSCITSELASYCLVVFKYLDSNKKQLKLLRELVNIGNSSVIKYDINKEIPSRDIHFWYTYHFYPKKLFSVIRKFLTRI